MSRMAVSNPKKRPASSQDGPAAKKANIQRPVKVDEKSKSKAPGRSIAGKDSKSLGKGNNKVHKKPRAEDDPKGKKRALPVTKALDEEDPDSDEEGASELDEDAIGEEHDTDVMDVDEEGGAVRTKDPNGKFFL
jgi:hypothetical protein